MNFRFKVGPRARKCALSIAGDVKCKHSEFLEPHLEDSKDEKAKSNR